LDQLCRAAGLVEADAPPGQLALQCGQPAALPTYYAGAVRVRARTGNRVVAPGAAAAGAVAVQLQFSLEPKAGWQERASVRLDRALDHLGQALKEISGTRP